MVVPNEPILEVTAPIAEAQLVETYLLSQVTFQTSLATKATRCRLGAGNIELVGFAGRRTQGGGRGHGHGDGCLAAGAFNVVSAGADEELLVPALADTGWRGRMALGRPPRPARRSNRGYRARRPPR